METLKKIFPLSFKYIGDIGKLIIGILVYLIVGALGGVLIGIVGAIPIIGILAWILGTALDVYVVAGIIIEILAHCKIIE